MKKEREKKIAHNIVLKISIESNSEMQKCDGLSSISPKNTITCNCSKQLYTMLVCAVLLRPKSPPFNRVFSNVQNISGCIPVAVGVHFVDVATLKVEITLVNIYIPVFIADCFGSPSASSTTLAVLLMLLTSAAGQMPFNGRQHIKLSDSL